MFVPTRARMRGAQRRATPERPPRARRWVRSDPSARLPGCSRRLVFAALCAIAAGAFGVRGGASAQAASQQPAGALPAVNLTQAVAQALRREPRAEIALQEIERADALVRQARAAAFPTLGANMTYTRLDHERALSNGTRLAGRDQLFGSFLLSVPIVAAQRWVVARHARYNAEVARMSAEEVRRQIALATAHAYLEVVAQKRVVEVDERAQANAKAHYEYAHARFTGGIGNELDDVRAGQELELATSQLEAARAALVSAQEALGVLLGENGPVDAAAPESLATAAAPPAFERIAQRGDVRTAQARVRLLERTVRDNWADYMPQLLGTFQPFYQNPSTPTFPTTGWQAQLILSVPLYDGGLRYGLADERRALASESRSALEGVLRQANSEVRVAFATLQRADPSLAAAGRAAALARRALQIANLAYSAGASTDIEVIDAERRARDAETTAVIAEDSARRARLDLLIATGQLP